MKKVLSHLVPLMGYGPYVEPMIGGGSVALQIAKTYPRKDIILNDLDPEVATFWRVVSGQEGQTAFLTLCREIELSRGPMDHPVRRLDYWIKIRESNFEEPGRRAFRFLFLNKTCFGGQIDEGPMGGWGQNGWAGRANRGLACQYTVKTILAQLHDANNLLGGRTRVENMDGLELLMSIKPPLTAYIDPPYFPGRSNQLYRFGMGLRQHEALADYLKKCPGSWLLSYDESSAVRALYGWAWIQPIEAKYSHGPGNRAWKCKTELLLAKRPIVPRTCAELRPNGGSSR